MNTQSTFEKTESVGASVDRMAEMRFKVLVADDSAADQLLAERRLGRSCCLDLVAAVTTGQMVIDYLAGRGKYSNRTEFPFPDLLLLDIDMPGMSGFDVLKWIKQHDFSSLRIVMLSGSTDPERVARALSLGADYYQAKNIHPTELNYFVRRLEFLMALLANRDVEKKRSINHMTSIVNSNILTIVDGRAPQWREAIISAADTGRNFLLILDSETELEKLWSALGTTNVVPDRLQRWGLLALVEALTAADYDYLQKSCKDDYVYLIEQITLNRNVPPRTKRYMLYCELRGIISDYDTLEEAGASLLSYLQGFKMARLLPLAGIYDHGSGKWERVKTLSSK